MKDILGLNIVASSAEAAGHGAEEGGHGLMEILQHHLAPTNVLVKIPPINIGGYELDISITKIVALMWVAAFLVILLGLAGRRIAQKPLAKPTRLSGLIEVFFLFVRDEIVHEHMHEYGVKKWTPYFVTLFFFIMFSNLLGLVPGSATATGNIAVTAGLAILSFLLIQLVGMLKQGVFAYWKNIVPQGVPWPLWFIMWPIEFFGLFTKPFALTIRLFANMTAGHVVILVLLFMIIKFENVAIAPLSVIGALMIYLLEVFICMIQAYIFVALTALFVGSAMHRH
jgi:F-type H+-transporting ATPase subunit a